MKITLKIVFQADSVKDQNKSVLWVSELYQPRTGIAHAYQGIWSRKR